MAELIIEIERKHMMATKAIHKMGDIISDNPDLCSVSKEDD